MSTNGSSANTSHSSSQEKLRQGEPPLAHRFGPDVHSSEEAHPQPAEDGDIVTSPDSDEDVE